MRDSQLAPSEIMGIAVAAAVSVGATVAGLARMDAPAGVRRSASRASNSVSGIAAEIPSLMERVKQQLQSVDYAPVRAEAAQRAQDVREDGVQRAQQLREDGMHLAANLFEQASGKASELVHNLPPREAVMQTVGERATQLRDRASELAQRGEENAQPAVSTALDTVREESAKAGRAAKSAGSDMLALSLWATVGAVLVWFGILSAEQRERIKTGAMRAVEEVSLLIQDFRGYDEDY